MKSHKYLPLLLLCTACDGADPCTASDTGELAFTIYGEEYIEESVPAEAFVDGWTVTFERFLLHVSELAAKHDVCEDEFRDSTGRLFNLAQGSGGKGHPVLTAQVLPGSYSEAEYRLGPAEAGTQLGNASSEDQTLMVDNGWSMYAEGTASRGSEVITFAWGYATDTTYGPCAADALVAEGDIDRVELTIHADHLFYDMLFAEDPNVAFDLIASADADGDGHVTRAELAATSILTQARYQVGSTGIEDLDAYVSAQTQTLGHINGEGHCGP